MKRYFTEETPAGFWFRSHPHELDFPGQPEWLVDLAYEHSGGKRHPAHATRGPCFLQVEGDWQNTGTRLVLPDCHGLVAAIAECLLSGWRSKPTHWNEEPHDSAVSTDWWLPAWLHRQTSRAIATQIHAQWTRLVNNAEPTVLAVHKAVFCADFGYDLSRSVILQEELYRERLLVKDIMAFRAAQVAAGIVTSIDRMEKWRSLFCPSNLSPYTSLNKTLNAVPGGVPARVLFGLRNVVLPRPVGNRLELISTILAGGSPHFHPIAHADAGEIIEVMKRVGRHLHRQFSHRRWRDVQDVVQFVCDFPDTHTGRILGLADKSIIWHRDCQAEEIRKCVEELGHNTALAVPPIPLPDIPGVRFLATVGDVCAEAELMEHCIASYAKRAYHGGCYLFHIDHEGDTASVEVSPDGHVVQSQGKRNQSNRATTWGAAILSRWGRVLRHAAKVASQSVAQPLGRENTQQLVSVDTAQRQILAKVLGDLEEKAIVPSMFSDLEFLEESIPSELDFLDELRRLV